MTSSINNITNQNIVKEISIKTNNENEDNGFMNIIDQIVQMLAQNGIENPQDGQVEGLDIVANLIESLKKQPTNQAIEAVMAIFVQSPQLIESFLEQVQVNPQINIDTNILSMNPKENIELLKNVCKDESGLEKIVTFLEELPKTEKQQINTQIRKMSNFKELFKELGGEVVTQPVEIPKPEKTQDYLSVLKSVSEYKQTKNTDKKTENKFDESQVKVFTVKDLIRNDNKNIEVKETSSNEPPKTDNFEIINQFKEGFLENINKKRFTVRLKPEGLGEITVNMINNEGKINLSILASNQTVQRALENHLVNLQTSLKQYNAEITSVNATTDKQQSNLDLGYGKDSNQHQHGGQNQNRQSKYAFEYSKNISDNSQEMKDLREYLIATNSLSMRV